MPSKDAAAVAAQWAQNLTAAVPRIKAGVMAVTESPTAKAAQAVDAYVAGVQRAAMTNKFQDGLNSVSLNDWQRATAEKGTAAIANGVAFAKPKMQKFLTWLLPQTEAIKQQIKSMPRGKGAAAKARMDANYAAMSALRYKGRA